MAPLTMSNFMPDFTGKLLYNGRFKLVRLLGAGGGGVVYLATDHRAPTSSSDTSPSQRAIKIVRKADGQALEYQKREIAIHRIVSDVPHVLPLHYAWEDDEYLYISMEYCETDLYRAIFERQAYWGNDELVRSVFLQILDAVQGCHERSVYHRDLKPENILCNAEGTEAYISDFGLATANRYSSTFCCGSLPYLGPECIGKDFRVEGYSTRRSDTWALGVVLVNMITGLCPWGKATSDDIRFCEYMLDSSYLERNLPVSRGVVRILSRVFRINPRSRPTLEQLRESIVAVDSFFPPARVPLRPESPYHAETDAVHTPELAVAEGEDADSEVTEQSPIGSTTASSSCSEEDLDSICLSTAGTSDGETTSTDDSAPATPPDCCPALVDQTVLVEGVDKALQSLTDAVGSEPAERAAELSILERLDIHAVE